MQVHYEIWDILLKYVSTRHNSNQDMNLEDPYKELDWMCRFFMVGF